MSSKLREALNKIGNITAWVAENCNDQQTAKYMNDIISIVQEALAEPIRNCDIGTTKEQAKRFDDFVCDRRGDRRCTGKCPVRNGMDFSLVECVIQWSQMPYEEEGAE